MLAKITYCLNTAHNEYYNNKFLFLFHIVIGTNKLYVRKPNHHENNYRTPWS